MTYDPFRSPAPWRHQFDHARDPYAARNSLGAVDAKYVADAIAAGGGGGGGGAPTNAEYITASADPTLTAERVLTNTATVTWDFSTAGQAKANAVTGGGGNVSNSGTPTSGQYAKWVTATTIQGVAPATVLSDIGAQPAGSYQPLDADLTSLAAAAATNAIYYRSAANTWATITIGAGLAFAGGTLSGATFSASVAGDVPASGGGTTNFLRADGAWAAAGGGSGVSSIAGNTGAFTLGLGLTNATNDIQVASSNVVQTAYAEVVTAGATSTAMAGGSDTVPQQTDGAQVITCSITPKASTSNLLIDVNAQFAVNTASNFWTALFRDATAAAIAAEFLGSAVGDTPTTARIVIRVAASSTSATTFKLRVGGFAGVSIGWNGVYAGRRLGGASRVTMTIHELKG